jgi:proteasome lid subunit RPN8/RPN11
LEAVSLSDLERVEVDPELEPVDISCRLLQEIQQHARETYPEECCGLLSGDDRLRFRRQHKCSNEMTLLHDADPAAYPFDGRYGFHMNPRDYMRAEGEAEAVGERITAVYHSHVGARAYFSRLDRAFASHPDFPFPDADHIVVAVVDGEVAKAERALFRREGRNGAFRGHPLRELLA